MMPTTVSTEWLDAERGAGDLRIIDASWHMPQQRRDAAREFLDARVPGAVFFDIDAVSDTSSPLPHMLPTANAFATAAGSLGIGNAHRVVVYDSTGIFSAARAWWTFRAFGHRAVAVLDGGLKKWRAEGRALESGQPQLRPCFFTATPQPHLVRSFAQMIANLYTAQEQVIDARSAGRFRGTEPEPRLGLRSGSMPGSLNLPFNALVRDDGSFHDDALMRQTFEAAGVKFSEPVVTTCGSGVTAAVLALALHRIGNVEAAIYDGSWAEWGAHPDAPVAGSVAQE